MKILFARSNQVVQGSKIESKQGEVSTEGRIDFTESYSHQKPLISPNIDNNCTTLTFKGFSLTGRELSFIPHIFPRLENIKLAGFLANMADSKRISILVGIANCIQIKGLDLSNNGLKGSDLEVLSSLKSLICLNLSKNPEICLYGLKFLATSNLAKQLCYLDISKGTVNTETLKFQNAKMKKKAERKIKLRSKDKKAYPTESITLTFPFDSIYENFVNLNYLDLSENNIGDIRAKKLSFPQSLQNLKLINNLLSSDIKSCLRTAYPSINIEF
jgi:Leucine-rich repeat (LRR) protein